LTGAIGPAGATGQQGAKGDLSPMTGALASGVTLRGDFSIGSQTTGQGYGGTYFPVMQVEGSLDYGGMALASAPVVHIVDRNEHNIAGCPGSASDPEAGPGILCLYLVSAGDPYVDRSLAKVLVRGAASNSGVERDYPSHGSAADPAQTIGDGTVDRFGAHVTVRFSPDSTTDPGGVLNATWAVTGD
jgi:hypothetical protein